MFAFASAGKGYDDVTKTADACADRCMAALSSSSFFLKGTQCGCSKTRVGPCTVKASGAYTAYEVRADVEGASQSKRSAALISRSSLPIFWMCDAAIISAADHAERRAPTSPKRRSQLAINDERCAASRRS